MTGTARVLWVTGAGSGMGRAAAIAAARAGWRVALSGRRAEALAETAATVRAAGGEALELPLDVRDAASVRDALDRIRADWGAVHDLVLSAGLNDPRRRWDDQSVDRFDEIVQTNLVAVARVVDAALPDLRASRGTVVVVSSYSGWRFSPGAGVAYGASKTALATLCATLNAEEAGSGVRACHLCPGDVDSDFLAMRPNVPDAASRSRMLTPDDVARAVHFVLSSPAHVRIDELVISPVSQA
ncbi:NADP-dependent 3-hydroxy acid dehydrogenase YdfG [Diaminobutyricimonas aerilata]|uniref:NADP-dependent 3-hydroxy acid dehydrogenase YdfG n=1 Tax=Diaminobutyricimonas aerilata TaxID=1162967 RepID=A0A2M9CMM4_9MICO|nr:SDR family oxidoreductase [Diaminobutyricimonas aerilata]PJJ73135.1 NADP-dependent 3-hydroxy acid dehydrogenase YdfG [Diaminobutyricimonas aerilata]